MCVYLLFSSHLKNLIFAPQMLVLDPESVCGGVPQKTPCVGSECRTALAGVGVSAAPKTRARIQGQTLHLHSGNGTPDLGMG